MLIIKENSIQKGLYNGRPLSPEDVVMIPAGIKSVEFPYGINIKSLMTGKGVRVICGAGTQIRHLSLGGDSLFRGNLFCGSVECEGLLVVRGQLTTWLGDVSSRNGSIIVDGPISSAGGVLAKNGSIIATLIEAEERVFSLNTWVGKQDETPVGMAAIAASEANLLEKSVIFTP